MESSVLIPICLIIGMLVVDSNGFKLTILHTNDIHGRIQEMNKYHGLCTTDQSTAGKCYGGMARLKTKVDEMRSKYPTLLLLDGGDQYQGSSLFYVYGGQIMSHFMDILGYNAMALGNHEFDDGPQGLVPFLDNVTFPVLVANIDVTDVPELALVKKYVVTDVSGQRIGIVGYITVKTPVLSYPGKVKFMDEISSLQAAVDEMVDQGVDKIIALGHAGFVKDKEIAQKVRGIDIVVGGHTNTFLYTGDAPANEIPEGVYPTVIRNDNGQDVLVVQDFAYGKYLGFLQVEFDDNGIPTAWNGNPILLDNTVAKDSYVTEVVKTYLPKVEKMMNEKIGQSLVYLNGSGNPCRVKECNLGNFLTDAMVRQSLRYTDSMEWNHVSIAIYQAGGIRGSIDRGDITAAGLTGAMPFKNSVDMVELTGDVIRQVLEFSASHWTNGGHLHGTFLQLSGLRVVYDMRQPIGSRVIRVNALCTECLVPEFKPLVMTRKYKVLMTSFLVGGGDDYSVIKDNIGQSRIIGSGHSQMLLDYAKENSPISTSIDGRIQFLEDIEEELCVGSNDSSATLPSIMLLLLFVYALF